jgi:sulfate transport system ATP-binding protein
LDLERIGGAGSLAARIVHINPVSSLVRVQLTAVELGVPILVEVTRERFEELALRVGETLYVSPRKARTFLPDYSI